MRWKAPLAAAAGLLAAWSALASRPGSDAALHWPQWRGPEGNGVAPHGEPPLTWSESSNVRFKVEIPGRGHASPVVWGDRIFLLTAVEVGEPAPAAPPTAAAPVPPAASAPAAALTPAPPPPASPAAEAQQRSGPPRSVAPDRELRFVVLALDRATGKVVWERTARQAKPHEGTHPDGTWASASAVTDGERVWASFGSQGIYCYDWDGKLLWERDLGDMQTRNGFGEGATPALHGDTLVVAWDHEGPGFLVALDSRTGAERWRVARDERTGWSTPRVVEVEGKPQVVVNATGKVRAHDLATGALVWETGGMTSNAIPSPVAGDGMLFVTSGFRGNALKAIRLAGARGDLSGTPAEAWSYDRDTPYVPSPLLYGGTLYFLKSNQAILTALDAATGKPVFGPERLPEVDGVYASPVAAAGRVYVPGRNGATAVLAHGPKLEVLAVNKLDDSFDASPAIVGKELYLRGRRYLYALAEGGAGR